MNKIGSGNSGELTFIDVISLMSFMIGILNLDENMTQSDKSDLQADLADKADRLLAEIHGHLESQDKQLTEILSKLTKVEDERKDD